MITHYHADSCNLASNGMTMKLTKTAIANAQAGTKEIVLWDTAVTGLGVRVQLSGRKTYILNYRLPNRKQKRLTLGTVALLELEDARRIARAKLIALAEGNDPAIGDRDAMTIEALFARYWDEHAQVYNKASTLQRVLAWWKHLKPVFGYKLVSEVRRSDVVAFHARMKSKPATANKCVTLLSILFNLANQWEWLTDGSNPARKIKKYREVHRTRILNDAELAAVLVECNSERTYKPFARLVKLLLLTGCRVSEIAKSKTAWIDWEAKLLRLPDSKSGAKNVSLSDAALAILSDVKTTWIIPARGDKGHIVKTQEYWNRLRKKIGLHDVRLHDLRHTVGSYAHKAGMSQREIADLLGHKQLATTARYINTIEGQTAKNVEKISAMFGAIKNPSIE